MLTPFVQGFVDQLKDTIPPGHRHWVPEYKGWRISEGWVDAAVEVADEWYDLRFAQEANISHAPAHQLLGLLPTADPAVIDAAYRALSKKWHPDAGGTNERMRDLNLAYERLRAS